MCRSLHYTKELCVIDNPHLSDEVLSKFLNVTPRYVKKIKIKNDISVSTDFKKRFKL